MGALQVGGPHRCREPVAGVVGETYRLLLGVERGDVTHRAEDLLLHAASFLGESTDDGRLDEGAGIALVAEVWHSAPADDLAVLAACQTVVGQHLVAMVARDEWSHVGPLEGTADPERPRARGERFEEALEQRPLDIHALGAQTYL